MQNLGLRDARRVKAGSRPPGNPVSHCLRRLESTPTEHSYRAISIARSRWLTDGLPFRRCELDATERFKSLPDRLSEISRSSRVLRQRRSEDVAGLVFH